MTISTSTLRNELMGKVWEAYWQPEPHGTQAALERVVALVLRQAAAKAYHICAETRHVSLGDKAHAAILTLSSAPTQSPTLPDFHGEPPALQSALQGKGDVI